MICVDEVYPKFCGMQELVVFDISSHVGVAALCVSIVNAVTARATHHREPVYRTTGRIVSQSLYPERSLALGQKVFHVLFLGQCADSAAAIGVQRALRLRAEQPYEDIINAALGDVEIRVHGYDCYVLCGQL